MHTKSLYIVFIYLLILCICESRTDVWAIGCLLFAWWFGYSPFECEFSENGEVRVVECTHLRVLSSLPSLPRGASRDDLMVMQLTQDILEQDLVKRAFLSSVISWARKTRSALNSTGSRSNAAFDLDV